MPYTKKQEDLARAVRHGFKPTRSAKGFTKKFAEQVKVESNSEAEAANRKGRRRY